MPISTRRSFPNEPLQKQGRVSVRPELTPTSPSRGDGSISVNIVPAPTTHPTPRFPR
ncbi:hypothetical protein K505DRAFT_326663 [Melanomma pulvis-pyrius CBS 109.77]|uniref:Uncharacterized protein n=1 Tax=Melanomma pulvis-pyrius CBS 109.77 TaxID=1314802 RepID=A0A6A6X5X1_9PLEO|nr:hypothetical protein K505DRAFT_326663 [Melanomma pulvis-pyrius CBS 109.77]